MLSAKVASAADRVACPKCQTIRARRLTADHLVDDHQMSRRLALEEAEALQALVPAPAPVVADDKAPTQATAEWRSVGSTARRWSAAPVVNKATTRGVEPAPAPPPKRGPSLSAPVVASARLGQRGPKPKAAARCTYCQRPVTKGHTKACPRGGGTGYSSQRRSKIAWAREQGRKEALEGRSVGQSIKALLAQRATLAAEIAGRTAELEAIDREMAEVRAALGETP